MNIKGSAWNYVIILGVGLWLGVIATIYGTSTSEEKDQVIREQEIQLEMLKERNTTLQLERDEVYDDYAILRDQLWNLNNSLERECSQ